MPTYTVQQIDSEHTLILKHVIIMQRRIKQGMPNLKFLFCPAYNRVWFNQTRYI